MIACSELSEELLETLLPSCRLRGVKLTVVPPTRGMFGTATHLTHIADLPLLDYNTWDISRMTLALKRGLDVVLAVVALASRFRSCCSSRSRRSSTPACPILFRQTRGGERGRPFQMLKFRTMVRNAEALLPELVPFEQLDAPMFKLKADPRVTRVGRLLRRTSIDELPQLVNVLRGEMSIVGPRPEQLDLVERYAPEHQFRLQVKPGHHRPDAGLRARRADLRRAAGGRARVRREPLACAGHPHRPDDASRRLRPPRRVLVPLVPAA